MFHEPTSGAESDLKAATSLARRMVGLWGMSEELGPVSYGVGETQPFLGREMALPREFAEATAAKIDAAVLELIESAHVQASDLLKAHRPVLDALAEELTAREVVDGPRLDEILASTETVPTAAEPRPAAGAPSRPLVSPAPIPIAAASAPKPSPPPGPGASADTKPPVR